MNTIIEQALQLPKEEKIELYNALKDELDEYSEDELTKEQWEELEKRQQSIEDGTAKFISGDEFLNKLQNLRNELLHKRS